MQRPKFDPAELESAGMYRPCGGVHGRVLPALPKFNTPVTPKENALLMLRDKMTPLWLPNLTQDFNMAQTLLMPDTRARIYGGLDWFGVEWIPQPEQNAAMVDHSKGHLLSDITNWESEVVWPNLNELDWAGDAEKIKASFDPDRLTYGVVVNGMFERLISLISFEEALVALMLEPDAVRSFFEALTRWYIKLFVILRKHYGLDIICFHDDWGSQRAQMFSTDCLKECVLPYIAQLVEEAHRLGMYFDLHSCGKIEPLVPLMIEVGVDAWEGQDINDKAALTREYGNRLVMMDVLNMSADAVPEDANRTIRDYIDTLAYSGGHLPKINNEDAAKLADQMKEFYRYSRIKYCG